MPLFGKASLRQIHGLWLVVSQSGFCSTDRILGNRRKRSKQCITCFGAKPANLTSPTKTAKKFGLLSFFTAKLWEFKDGWRRRTFFEWGLLSWGTGNVWALFIYYYIIGIWLKIIALEVALASYQRSLPQPALNSSQLHLDYIPPLLFSGQYLYTRSAFHLAKISGLSFRKISSSNGKAFSLPGIEPRFESYTWHFIG